MNSQEVVVRHALSSEKNLEVAFAVRASFDSIVLQVLRKFLDELRDSLAASLGNEWSVSITPNNILSKGVANGHHLLTLGKGRWEKALPLVFGTDVSNDIVFIALYRSSLVVLADEDARSIREDLNNASSEVVRFENPAWPAYWNLTQSPYGGYWNYANPDPFKHMYFNTPETVQYFSEMIVLFARVVGAVLDRIFAGQPTP